MPLRLILECALELFQEAGIVLREHAEVTYTVFQVGDTLHAHTEGIARVDAGVNTAGVKVVRVYHAAAQNLYPACTLAERAALAAADVA